MNLVASYSIHDKVPRVIEQHRKEQFYIVELWAVGTNINNLPVQCSGELKPKSRCRLSSIIELALSEFTDLLDGECEHSHIATIEQGGFKVFRVR